MSAFAQNRGNIQGKIIDSANHEPMDFATVAAVNPKDSSLISYTLTSKGGTFALHNLPAGMPLKLVVSFVSYQNYREAFMLNKGETHDFGAIKLSSKISSLNEVKITADAPPVVAKKDTIEFSVEAFKTPPNAVVEELLRRLPGVEVDMDGTITYNGKKVSKLMVNGKRFFANDPRIASKNLDAALISKVQVYDDREDDPDHLIPDSKVDKIINLKLKAAIKRSTFGKLHGGSGSRDRWDAGLLYNQMRDTLQASLILVGNNLNRTGFNSNDLGTMGGFNRSNGPGGGYNTGIATGGRNPSGIQTVASGGLNLNNDYGKKLKVNLLYFYSYTKDENNTAYLGEQIFSDTTLSSRSGNSRNNVSKNHNISGLVEWNPDTTTKIRYQPKVTFTNSNGYNQSNSFTYNNFVPQINQTDNSSNSNNSSFQFQHNLNYYHQKGKDGPSINITHSLSITPSNGQGYNTNLITSYTSALPSANLYRLSDDANESSNGNLSINYRYPFNKKFTGTVNANASYSYNHGRNFIYDEDLKTGQYTIYIDSLSRNMIRRQMTETLHPELQYQVTKKTRFTAGLDVQLMQTYNIFHRNLPDLNRHDVFLMPSFSMYTGNFSFDYNNYVRQPDINSLLPDTLVYNQLSSSAGNPDLKPTRTHSFYGSYYANNSDKNINYNIYGGLSIDENSISSQRVITPQGASFSRPINRNGSYYGYAGVFFSKGFKKINKWQIRYSPRISFSYQRNFFQINNKEGFTLSYSGQFSQQCYLNYDNKFDLNPSINISPRITTYQDVDYPRVNYVSRGFSLPVNVRGVKHWVFEANYDYTYNPLATQGFQRTMNIVNLAVTRLFQFRDRGEIKLSCYDLFDQNVSVYRYATGNTTADVQSLVLKRYFLLTYAYRFTKTITKK